MNEAPSAPLDPRFEAAKLTSHRSGGAFSGDPHAFLPRRIHIGWIFLGWMISAGGIVYGLLQL